MQKTILTICAVSSAVALLLSMTACGTAGGGETNTSPVTDAETETQIVQVTDANGEVVTDASGEAVTRIETVDVPTKGSNQQSGGTGTGQQTGGNPGSGTGEKTNGTGTGGSQGGGSGSGQQGGSSGGNGGTSGGSSGGSGSGNGGSSNGGGSVTPTPTPDPNPNPAPTPTPQRTWEYLPDLSRQTFDAMNQFRKDNGVAPLAYSQDCQNKANNRAAYDAENNIKTSLHGNNEIGIMTNYGVTSGSSLIKMWADSVGHKKNMLDTSIVYGAVSVYKDSNGCFWAIAHFDDGQDWEWQ